MRKSIDLGKGWKERKHFVGAASGPPSHVLAWPVAGGVPGGWAGQGFLQHGGREGVPAVVSAALPSLPARRAKREPLPAHDASWG